MSGSSAVVGGYRLIELLGRGGMAEVWKARRSGPAGFTRDVVIKRILPLYAEDPAFVRMFLAEARIAARLGHANIVQVFELGEDRGSYFIAMELLRGRDLASLLRAARARPLPPAFAAFVVREVARALGYIHTLAGDDGRPRGLIHRDVTPANVMVCLDGSVKLLDFGIAKALTDAAEPGTQVGQVKGKPGYLAPEQVAGADFDHRVDLFAAGVVLYELLLGRRLFAAGGAEVFAQLRGACLEPPSQRVAGVPPALDAICLRALAYEPAARFQSADELAAALDEVVRALQWGPAQSAALLRGWLAAGDEGADGGGRARTLTQAPEPEAAAWASPRPRGRGRLLAGFGLAAGVALAAAIGQSRLRPAMVKPLAARPAAAAAAASETTRPAGAATAPMVKPLVTRPAAATADGKAAGPAGAATAPMVKPLAARPAAATADGKAAGPAGAEAAPMVKPLAVAGPAAATLAADEAAGRSGAATAPMVKPLAAGPAAAMLAADEAVGPAGAATRPMVKPLAATAAARPRPHAMAARRAAAMVKPVDVRAGALADPFRSGP